MTDVASLVSPSDASLPPPPPAPAPSTSHAYDPMRDTETGEAPSADADADTAAANGGVQSDSSDSQDAPGSQERAHDGTSPAATNTDNAMSGSSSSSGAVGNPDASLVQTLTKRALPACMANSKIKHLKKMDGIPLWRADIQYDFLYAVFHDTQPVFTNSYDGKTGQTFADVYVDAMARSSKTSKILRDKLMTERANALNMAMVCLLVNLGRMNTTLNFFPEMKAQLRTYHAIPSLQAHSDSNAYKQLQDAPRLKSILKGACEDRKEPQTLDQIMEAPIPRTNPINLVFVLSTYAPRITEVNFPDNIDFHDLVMRPTLSSKSRARAFLWLMWFYLEGKLDEDSCKNNPFGEGRAKPGSTLPCCVPEFEFLTEEQAALENVDTEFEKEFGEEKQRERKRLLGDQINAPPGTGRGRGGRKSANFAGTPDAGSPSGSPPPSKRKLQPRYSYADGSFDFESEPRTRSGSPDSFSTPFNPLRSSSIRRPNATTNPRLSTSGFDILSPMEIRSKQAGPGSVTSTTKRNGKRTHDGEVKPPYPRHSKPFPSARLIAPSFFSRAGSNTPSSLPSKAGARLTQHQIAVQRNRDEIVDHIIFRKLKRLDRKRRKTRQRTGAIARAWERIKDIEDPLMQSDDETGGPGADLFHHHDDDDHHHHPPTLTKKRKALHEKLGWSNSSPTKNEKLPRHPAGVVYRKEEEFAEEDDFGEEQMELAAAVRRSLRRVERWGMQKRREELMGDQAGASKSGGAGAAVEGGGGEGEEGAGTVNGGIDTAAGAGERRESDATVDDPDMHIDPRAGGDDDDDDDDDDGDDELVDAPPAVAAAAVAPVIKSEEGLGEVAMSGM